MRHGDPLPNELYPRLAAVAQPGYVDDKVPLHPARAVAELGSALPAGGFLTAEPGVAGLWVARTFPTPALEPGAPRRVVVPARRGPAPVVSQAIAEARRGRPSITVTTLPPDDRTLAELHAVADDTLALVVVGWSDDGPARDAGAFADAVRAALARQRPTLIETAVCLADTQLLVDAAGEVVAWGGL